MAWRRSFVDLEPLVGERRAMMMPQREHQVFTFEALFRATGPPQQFDRWLSRGIGEADPRDEVRAGDARVPACAKL